MILLCESMSCLKRQRLSKQETGDLSGFFMALFSTSLESLSLVKAH